MHQTEVKALLGSLGRSFEEKEMMKDKIRGMFFKWSKES